LPDWSLEPRIEILPEKKFIGKHIRMSFSTNKTMELWKSFMPVKKKIKNVIGSELYSIEVYERLFFSNFIPEREFDKWAAVEVTGFDSVPDKMETFTLPGGFYAVFKHTGPASKGPETYRYIFETWLPASGHILDNRPHFAVMGEKYKNEDPDSEEEIWIPIKMH
jgi:AraC family transcriptional regulator